MVLVLMVWRSACWSGQPGHPRDATLACRQLNCELGIFVKSLAID